MIKLLSANLYRLRKSRVFWVELGFTLVFSLLICKWNYSPAIQSSQNPVYLDDVFFIYYELLGFVLAAGISLLVGTEYSDGTLRNKLIVGHSRGSVFLSHLLASVSTSVLLLLIHGAVSGAVGFYLFGGFQLSVSQVAYTMACIFLSTAVYTAIFLCITINGSNKAVSAVLCLLLALVLLYLSSWLGAALVEPEVIHSQVIISLDGISYGPEIPNPAYLSGLRRSVCEFFYDLLPSGQLNQIIQQDFARAARWPWFSLAFFAAVTWVGLLSFRQKNVQ